jgi:hypothetical protein
MINAPASLIDHDDLRPNRSDGRLLRTRAVGDDALHVTLLCSRLEHTSVFRATMPHERATRPGAFGRRGNACAPYIDYQRLTMSAGSISTRRLRFLVWIEVCVPSP